MHYLVLALLLMVSGEAARAATYYLDPVKGSLKNSGSIDSPWPSLQAVLAANRITARRWTTPYTDASTLRMVNPGAPVKGGDTLVLLEGHHGEIQVQGLINDDYIHIVAADQARATVSRISIVASAYWRIEGLVVSAEFLPDVPAWRTLLDVNSHAHHGPSHHVQLLDNKVFTATDITNWTAGDWVARVKNGISLNAVHSLAKGNQVYNIGIGIQALADNITVENNQIINFSVDGLRGLGNDSTYVDNLIANGFKVDDNHDDGFQSWSRDGKPVKNVILERNRIFWDYYHPNPRLRSDFQGIGCFDGIYENWRVRNNLVVVNDWHGITFLGAVNSEIINNTIVDADDDARKGPRISVGDHKQGTPSRGMLVRNNLSEIKNTSAGVAADHNMPVTDKKAHFVDHGRHNFELKKASRARSAGLGTGAPGVDLQGRQRTGAVDLGAFQYSEKQGAPQNLEIKNYDTRDVQR